MVAARAASGLRWPVLAALLVLAFAYRLGFGLASEFWSQDETQIYLLGLRYHATASWPYFGPDVVWTESRIPGALQALLVGLPLRLVPVPEAPFVLLNVLSLAALCLFAAYVCRRLPELPVWFVGGWLFTLPWTLNFSTHVVNPSYVLPASIVFFVGFFEALPALRGGLLALPLAHAMMGFALLWTMQIHMSWVALLPFLFLALLVRAREGAQPLLVALFATAAGVALPAALLAPTLVTLGVGAGETLRTVHLQWVGPWTLLTITAQFLSFASFEVNRFLGLSNALRLTLFLDHPWLGPLAVVVGAVGVLQPLVMVVLCFRPSKAHSEWRAVRLLALGTVLLVYASYFFSIPEPRAHAFYVVAPVAFVYGFYCWSLLAHGRRWRVTGGALLALTVAFHAGLALARGPARSLYKNRDLVATALRARRPEMFARPRPFALAPGEQAPASDPKADLRIVKAVMRQERGWAWLRKLVLRSEGPVALWKLVVRNEGAVAYRDLRYVTEYHSAGGERVGGSERQILEVIQPGETLRLFGVNDGFVDARAVAGELRIVAAQALVPLRAVSVLTTP